MVDIIAKHKSLLVQWVYESIQDPIFSLVAIEALLPNTGHFLWQCYLHSKNVNDIIINDIFWKDVLIAWCQFHYIEPKETEIGKQILWCNSHITINKKVIVWDNFFELGIKY